MKYLIHILFFCQSFLLVQISCITQQRTEQYYADPVDDRYYDQQANPRLQYEYEDQREIPEASSRYSTHQESRYYQEQPRQVVQSLAQSKLLEDDYVQRWLSRTKSRDAGSDPSLDQKSYRPEYQPQPASRPAPERYEHTLELRAELPTDPPKVIYRNIEKPVTPTKQASRTYEDIPPEVQYRDAPRETPAPRESQTSQARQEYLRSALREYYGENEVSRRPVEPAPRYQQVPQQKPQRYYEEEYYPRREPLYEEAPRARAAPNQIPVARSAANQIPIERSVPNQSTRPAAPSYAPSAPAARPKAPSSGTTAPGLGVLANHPDYLVTTDTSKFKPHTATRIVVKQKLTKLLDQLNIQPLSPTRRRKEAALLKLQRQQRSQ